MERQFLEEYVANDENAVRAYMKVFGNGYKVSSVLSTRLLEEVRIQEELKAVKAEYARRVRVSPAKVLKELALIAFADPGEAFEPDPSGGQDIPKPMSKITPATRRAIGAAKTKRRRIVGEGQELYEVEEVAYTFANKIAALDSLCKKLGLFKDDKADPLAGMTDAQKLELLHSLVGGR